MDSSQFNVSIVGAGHARDQLRKIRARLVAGMARSYGYRIVIASLMEGSIASRNACIRSRATPGSSV